MYLTCITITQSTIITSPIGFNIGLTNVDTRLKQRCINVVSTLFQRRTLTLYQRCATLKIRRRILFHFQRRINVISTLIHNVETTLIRCWNVGSGGLYYWPFSNLSDFCTLLSLNNELLNYDPPSILEYCSKNSTSPVNY